jgi:hypothetical protein
MQTGHHDALPNLESTNFSVLRLRRDVLSQGSIGALFTRRSHSRVSPTGSNETLGIDGNVSVGDVFISGFFANTWTDGMTGDDQSYRAGFSYNADLFGASATYLRVGEDFNPEVGFLRRWGFSESMASARWSPRPESDLIRAYTFQLGTDYIENDTTGLVEGREHQASAQLEFLSSDAISVTYTDTYEYLDSNFRIADGVVVPPGGYSFGDVTARLAIGAQRRFSGNVSVQHGGFYGGDKTTVGLQGGRLNVNARLSIEPTISFNWVDLPQGSFRSDLAVARVNYAFTPFAFFGGLVQYNSGNDSFSSNLRFRWEYRPGSELFLVYSEARDTDVLDRFAVLQNRGLTIKLTYLLRM